MPYMSAEDYHAEVFLTRVAGPKTIYPIPYQIAQRKTITPRFPRSESPGQRPYTLHPTRWLSGRPSRHVSQTGVAERLPQQTLDPKPRMQLRRPAA